MLMTLSRGEFVLDSEAVCKKLGGCDSMMCYFYLLSGGPHCGVELSHR